jgi:Fur family transcriptional regulator, ferric uptake regulator
LDLEKEFIRQMRANGERLSSPRLAVFRVLARQNSTRIPDLVATMQRHGLDRATTYRTIKLLRKLGMVRDVTAGGHRVIELTDSFRGHHHHFWCRNCGKLVDFDDDELEKELHRAAKRLGIQLSSHQLEMSGFCEKCQKTQSTTNL